MGKKYNDKVVNAMFNYKVEDTNIKWTLKPVDYDSSAVENISNGFSKCYAHGFEKTEIENIALKFINETGEYSPQFNRLYLLKQLSYKLLNPAYQDSRVCFDHYFDWIGITNKLSEEILVEFLKGMDGDNRISKYLISVPHDFYSLNSILFNNEQFAKAEQHMHINASSLNFNFSYYALAYLPTNYSKLNKIINSYKPISLEQEQVRNNKVIMYKVVLLRHLFDCILRDYDSFIEKAVDELKEKWSSQNIIQELFSAIYNFNELNVSHVSIAKFVLSNSNILFDVTQFDFENKEQLYYFLDYERSFIRTIVNKYKNHDVFNGHVFMYLYYKNLCHSIFVSKNVRSTFCEFKSKEENKNLFISSDRHLITLYYRSIYWIYENDNVNKLEWRVAPKEDYIEHFKQIKRISNDVNLSNRPAPTDKITIRPIIHFIKQNFSNNCKHSSFHCFCSKVDEYMQMMECYKNEASTTRELALTKSKLNDRYRVIGIDAASDELKSPPEILGVAYRLMRRPNSFSDTDDYVDGEPIRFTYHVGEVYANVLTGIRRIDEVVDYLQFQSGDRIGHGVALGIDIEREYSLKTSSYQKLGERLDDLVWLYDKLVDTHYEDATNILKLKQEIDVYLSKVNNALGSVYPPFTLEEYRKSLKLRSDKYSYDYIDLDYKELVQESYYNFEIVENYNIKLCGYAEAFQNRNARLLYELYRTNSVFCTVYNESIQVKNNINNLVDMVSYVQIMIREKIARKDITVEVNISSNYFISNMTRYEQHPLFSFVPVDKSNLKNSLQVSINTDDSAIFQTSINREYSIIAKTLSSQGYSNIEVCEYIERLIKMSNRTSWIKV